jgi:hypothetical protein
MKEWIINKQTKSNKLPSKTTSAFSDLIPMGLSIHVFTPRNVVTNSLCTTWGIMQRRFNLNSDCILWFEDFNWDWKRVLAKFVVCLSNLCSINSNRCWVSINNQQSTINKNQQFQTQICEMKCNTKSKSYPLCRCLHKPVERYCFRDEVLMK